MVDTFQKGQLGVRHPLRRVLRTEKDLVLPGQPLIGIPRYPIKPRQFAQTVSDISC